MEAPLGEVAQISEARVALAQRLVLLKTDANRCTPDYLAFALRSTRMQHRLRAYATGSTALGIKADRLKGLLVPVPSLTRQAEAVAALRCEEGAKMQVARLLSHQLNLLAEHRQAIITAAITGEFQVPGAA
jgi:type I restriction enzyme S subunit